MPLVVRIYEKGNDRSFLSMTLQITILSGGLILCKLSKSKFPLGTISKFPLGTRINETVLLLGLPLYIWLYIWIGIAIGYDIEIAIGHEIKQLGITNGFAIGHRIIWIEIAMGNDIEISIGHEIKRIGIAIRFAIGHRIIWIEITIRYDIEIVIGYGRMWYSIVSLIGYQRKGQIKLTSELVR